MLSIFFKYFIKSYFSWYIFILFIVVPNNTKANDAIIFGTMQKIGNINPFSYTSYPAELIVQFTTERLIKRMCYDFDIFSSSAGFMAELIDNKRFFRYYKPFDSIFYLTELQSGISFSDISYTIRQINQTPANRYQTHSLVYHDQSIEIQSPYMSLFSKAALAFTFPIIKTNKLTPKHLILNNKDIVLYNTATTGLYCIKNIQPNRVELESRKQYFRPIIFRSFNSWEQFIKNILKGTIHVVLGISGKLIHQINGFDQYFLEETEDLKSFTYFGFNYNTTNVRIRKLFEINSEFRKAFAFTICNLSIIREKLHKYGDPNDHTFDHIRSIENYPIDYMYAPSGIIEALVQSNIQTEAVRISILYKPDFIFGQQQFNSIICELNQFFLQARIQFKAIAIQDIKEFEKIKKNGYFDIIFDTFTYGQNQVRYIDFLDPQNSESNFLKCTLFRNEEIKRYKTRFEKRDDFLLRINKELPVFVLGTFQRMNAISKRIVRKNSCQKKKLRSVPFSNIHKWEISPK